MTLKQPILLPQPKPLVATTIKQPVLPVQMDQLRQWVNERLDATGKLTDFIQCLKAHTAYKKWCLERGATCYTPRQFYKHMKKMGFKSKRGVISITGTRDVAFYFGWKVLELPKHVYAPEIVATNKKARKKALDTTKTVLRKRHAPTTGAFTVHVCFPLDTVTVIHGRRTFKLTLAQALEQIDYGQQLIRLYQAMKSWQKPRPLTAKEKQSGKKSDPLADNTFKFEVFNQPNYDCNQHRELHFTMVSRLLNVVHCSALDEFETANTYQLAQIKYPHLKVLPLECLKLKITTRSTWYDTKKATQKAAEAKVAIAHG